MIHLCFVSLISISVCYAQQYYDPNSCNLNETISGSRYTCNSTNHSCKTFLVYKANKNFQTISNISALFHMQTHDILELNNLTSSSDVLEEGKEVLVPINCSCIGQFYQFNSFTYRVTHNTTFYDVACQVFEGLLSPVTLSEENVPLGNKPDSGFEIKIPLRCACVDDVISSMMKVKYLVTYPVVLGDDPGKLTKKFGVSGDDFYAANGLKDWATIFPKTSVLIPIKDVPIKIFDVQDSPSPPPGFLPTTPVVEAGETTQGSDLYIAGPLIGFGLLIALLASGLYVKSLKKWKNDAVVPSSDSNSTNLICSTTGSSPMYMETSRRCSTASWLTPDLLAEIKYCLVNYTIEEIEKATKNFSEENKIGDLAYKGLLNNLEEVMVKRMRFEDTGQIPQFAFEKFPGSKPILTTQMKSVGEAMATGRTFQESFQKAVRSLEHGYPGWGCSKVKELDYDWEQLKYSLRVPNPERIHAIYAAMKKGMSIDEIFELSYIDKWFLTQLKELVDVESFLMSRYLFDLTNVDLYEVKKRGFSDKQIAFATKSAEKEVRCRRLSLGVTPAYKRVDTCAAEFEANTPYMYSSYDFECESAPTKRKKVLILGGGPNRIGQGIEFDYCCCHASFALQDAGYETIMVNSNPETVSTDYDTSDRLYFEPLTVEDVLNIIDLERPDGIIVQFGGQTPLKLSLPIQQYLDEHKPACASGLGHVRIWGTSPDSIDAAEDRERFNVMLNELKIEQPKGGIARSEKDALAIAAEIGYPVVVRPSYVLGGRAMEIVYSDDKLVTYLETAVEVDPERPVLIDKYLSDAIEIDVDALADSHGNVVIGGIMEHIEQAGVHSGDSACSIPTRTVPSSCLETIRSWTEKLAKRLDVCGLMNCQYAINNSEEVFLLEANPRASRTVPFVSKAIGHPLAKYTSLVMSGKSLYDIQFTKEVIPKYVSVKEAVLPFSKFAGCDVLLSPEMRSTGEVMGIDSLYNTAFAKAQIAAGQKLPTSGIVFLSLNDLTKRHLEKIAKTFVEAGFKIVATSGTAHALKSANIQAERVLKMHEGRPHAGDMIANGDIQLMVITSSGDALDQIDGLALRRMALDYKVPIVTTVNGAIATAEAIKSLKSNSIKMIALQDFIECKESE